MATFLRPRIPKPFRTARPMASGPVRRLPAWLDGGVAAVAVGILVTSVGPLPGVDAAGRGWAVQAAGDAAPSERAVLVTVSPETLRGGTCGRALAEVLRAGEVRGALLLEPLDALCALDAASGAALDKVPAHATPPNASLGVGSLHLRGGAVVGFTPEAEGALGTLGLVPERWVTPHAVPVMALGDLAQGAVPPEVLRGRVALVAMGTSGALLPGDGAAALLGGLAEGGGRREAPFWAAPLFVLAAGALMRWASRRGVLAATLAFATLAAALFGGQVLLAGRVVAGLLPMASAFLGMAVAFVGVLSTRAFKASAAARKAGGLLERAAPSRMESMYTLSDADFWLRVARLAEQAHPSDAALVADLPPAGWHLRFWNDRQGGERMVAEKRRDVRRTPFSDTPGVYKNQALKGFLTREEMPVVAIPLIASGDLEGYVFLCGTAAETTFTREPERAERLGRELGLLARRRRLARSVVVAGGGRDKALVTGAEGVLGDLRLLGAAMRGTPAEVLVADTFGDVRIMSRELLAWLKAREVSVPPEGPGGVLAPGSLSLSEVLAVAKGVGAEKGANTRAASQILTRVMEREEGLDVPVAGPEPAVLHVRAVRQEADGLSWVAGYVAALTRVESGGAAANVRSISGRDSFDPLVPFALGEVVVDAVAACARGSGRALKLDPIRGATHTLGHRAELSQALEAFLLDISSRALPGHQPAVSVRDTPQGPQLSILDVGFGLGLPESALERVLVAPSAAPSGLETLGRLIVAVEDSHGQAELRTNDGWGITLVMTFLRAQPRLGQETARATPAPASSPNVYALGRKQG
ncbi:hypothetical protein [Chondromyces apiculatus]|uniref:hypothetical protein n=1 Tax=Chondromyces apiculatus TaxID=51 RepID=UPI001E5BAC07|nr:hypothetical protein [Chondromyces apiculatus]